MKKPFKLINTASVSNSAIIVLLSFVLTKEISSAVSQYPKISHTRATVIYGNPSKSRFAFHLKTGIKENMHHWENLFTGHSRFAT